MCIIFFFFFRPEAASLELLNRTKPPFWVKLSSAWGCSLLYLYKLVFLVCHNPKDGDEENIQLTDNPRNENPENIEITVEPSGHSKRKRRGSRNSVRPAESDRRHSKKTNSTREDSESRISRTDSESRTNRNSKSSVKVSKTSKHGGKRTKSQTQNSSAPDATKEKRRSSSKSPKHKHDR